MWQMSPPTGLWRVLDGALAKGAGVGERDDVTSYGHRRTAIPVEHLGKVIQEAEASGNHPKNRLFPKDGRRCSCLVFWRASPQWGTSGQKQKPSWGSLKAWLQAGSPPCCVLKGKPLTVSKCQSAHLQNGERMAFSFLHQGEP